VKAKMRRLSLAIAAENRDKDRWQIDEAKRNLSLK